MSKKLFSYINRLTAGTPEETACNEVLYANKEIKFGDKKLNSIAALTYNQPTCVKVFNMIETALDPAESSWMTLHNCLVLIRTIVTYGSESAVDKAIAISRFAFALQTYNSALVSKSGGMDHGAPVRAEAKVLYSILQSDTTIRDARREARSQSGTLVPVGATTQADDVPDNISFGQAVEKPIGAGHGLDKVPGMYEDRPERYFDDSNDVRKRPVVSESMDQGEEEEAPSYEGTPTIPYAPPEIDLLDLAYDDTPTTAPTQQSHPGVSAAPVDLFDLSATPSPPATMFQSTSPPSLQSEPVVFAVLHLPPQQEQPQSIYGSPTQRSPLMLPPEQPQPYLQSFPSAPHPNMPLQQGVYGVPAPHIVPPPQVYYGSPSQQPPMNAFPSQQLPPNAGVPYGAYAFPQSQPVAFPYPQQPQGLSMQPQGPPAFSAEYHQPHVPAPQQYNSPSQSHILPQPQQQPSVQPISPSGDLFQFESVAPVASVQPAVVESIPLLPVAPVVVMEAPIPPPPEPEVASPPAMVPRESKVNAMDDFMLQQMSSFKINAAPSKPAETPVAVPEEVPVPVITPQTLSPVPPPQSMGMHPMPGYPPMNPYGVPPPAMMMPPQYYSMAPQVPPVMAAYDDLSALPPPPPPPLPMEEEDVPPPIPPPPPEMF